MAFSFGQSTGTPGPNASSFGATGPSTGTPFGTSGGLFGSQNNTSFGSLPVFGAGAPAGQSTLSFGTPGQGTAFGGASKPSMFGAASTPSFFGGGQAVSPSPAGGFSFTPSSTHSFLNPGTGTGIGGTFQGQPATQGTQQLLTKDNRPIAHSSNWDDLNPQAQQYLLDLEYVGGILVHVPLLGAYTFDIISCSICLLVIIYSRLTS